MEGRQSPAPSQKMHVEVSLELLKLESKILHEYCMLHSRDMLTIMIDFRRTFTLVATKGDINTCTSKKDA